MTLVRASAADHVAGLRQQDGADIGVHGSISLARSLLRASSSTNSASSWRRWSGRHLFAGGGALERFDPVDVDRTATGLLLLGYQKK